MLEIRCEAFIVLLWKTTVLRVLFNATIIA